MSFLVPGVWALGCALCVATPSLVAQTDSARNLTGTVTDHHHEPMKGAIVQVQNEQTNSVVSYIADGNGFYSFKRLSAGTDYLIWATYRGRRSKDHELSHFDSKTNPVVNLEVPSF